MDVSGRTEAPAAIRRRTAVRSDDWQARWRGVMREESGESIRGGGEGEEEGEEKEEEEEEAKAGDSRMTLTGCTLSL